MLKRLVGLLAALLLFPMSMLTAQEEGTLNGSWLGSLSVGGATLRLTLDISGTDDALEVELRSVDQGNVSIPMGEATLTDGSFSLVMPAINGSYAGTVAEDGNAIDGTWSQNGNDLPLRFERNEGGVPEANRPQEPEAPFPYSIEDVEFENPDGGHTLAGTLTLPENPIASVVLVSGSGPQDRDETIMGHKPFWVLADRLSRAGIAVLRYDDRGVAGSTGDFASSTSFDFATDAHAAAQYLAARPETDAGKVGIVGHSEGGLVAPIVAANHDDLAFIVLLAGPGTTGREILLAQQALILEANGASAEDVERASTNQRALLDILAHSPDETLEEDLEAAIRQSLEDMSPEMREAEGVATEEDVNRTVTQMKAQLATPWFRTFVTYDPRTTLEQVSIPVLAVNGKKDLQVPWEDNLREIEKALASGGNEHVTTKAFDDLNHLFQHAETGSPNEYSTIEETFAEDVMTFVATWIAEQMDGAS